MVICPKCGTDLMIDNTTIEIYDMIETPEIVTLVDCSNCGLHGLIKWFVGEFRHNNT